MKYLITNETLDDALFVEGYDEARRIALDRVKRDPLKSIHIYQRVALAYTTVTAQVSERDEPKDG